MEEEEDHQGRTEPESTIIRSLLSTKRKQDDDDELIELAKSKINEAVEENQRLRAHLDRALKDYEALQMQYQHVINQLEDKKLGTQILPVSLCRLGTTSSHEVNNNVEQQLITEEGEKETNSPSTTVLNSAKNRADDHEPPQQSPAKKTRVSVRVRCDTPTMNDGCQWRKYGQKTAKGNPCPRAYYRCTAAPSCPVKKHVQRCAEDVSILITTYEGTHDHPLSISAGAMASTTSAAASMLLSGVTSSSTADLINGLNFSLFDNVKKSKPCDIPSSSSTLTLDLTSSPSLSSSSHDLSRPYGNFPFSSFRGNNAILDYGCENRTTTNSLSFGSNPKENSYGKPYSQTNTLITPNQQTISPDTIAAATKAITSNPSFRSALASAVSSMFGSPATEKSGHSNS